jgi:hypothetical protein
LQPGADGAGTSNGRADVCLPFGRLVFRRRGPVFEICLGKNYRFRVICGFRLLFLCNRQDADTKEWWDRRVQKTVVKKSKKDVKTNTYNSSPLSLFLVLEKVISLFADRAPRVHP